MVLSAALYFDERETKFGKANYRVRQAVIGAFFGGVAVLATAFGVQSEEAVLNVRITKIRRLGVNMGKYRVKQGNISRFWPIFFDFENIFRKKYEPWNRYYAPDWCIFFEPSTQQVKWSNRTEIERIFEIVYFCMLITNYILLMNQVIIFIKRFKIKKFCVFLLHFCCAYLLIILYVVKSVCLHGINIG